MLTRRHTLKGRGFQRKEPEAIARDRAASRAANIDLLLSTTGRAGVTMGGSTSGVELPRSTPLRNRRLLDLAQGRRCLLAVPGVCTNDCRTVVACHSNWYDHGKAGARKADDVFTVWGCSACHRWLDQGRARLTEKRHVFDCAHTNQVFWWTHIAADATEKDADRRAAQWALDHLRTP